MEKTAFRSDGKQWNADCVLDVVRGSLLFDNMEDMATCLKMIDASKSVNIVRIKNRFAHPTDGGWRDCLLNITFVNQNDTTINNDAHKILPCVICEVQLIHRNLMLARKGMAGHNDYTTYRSGVELQEACNVLGKSATKHAFDVDRLSVIEE